MLNAFRRHGRGRLRASTSMPAISGAQRLSASWSRAGSRPGRGQDGPACAQRLSASWSRAAPVIAIARATASVLNAFRRHGRGRAMLACTPVQAGRGVLNAFRRHGRGRASLGTHPTIEAGAQRLSASWSRAEDRPLIGGGQQLVLNAFRRHGRGRSLFQSMKRALVDVLNAFRRHGRGRSITVPRFVAKETCSTPFGVMVEGGASSRG